MPEFVPLDVWFAPREHEPPKSAAVLDTATAVDREPADVMEAVAQARRFSAALSDAVAAALDDVLRDIACDVLARELMLAPADIAAIARHALERYAGDTPLKLRVHPDDLSTVESLEVPAAVDPQLRRGDVTLDLRSGSIDASLHARLESLLSQR
jgi:flagellar biosynthesis/type III secretory pathway protein FliH